MTQVLEAGLFRQTMFVKTGRACSKADGWLPSAFFIFQPSAISHQPSAVSL